MGLVREVAGCERNTVFKQHIEYTTLRMGQNLSPVFPTKRGSNQSHQLHRLQLGNRKFTCSKLRYDIFQLNDLKCSQWAPDLLNNVKIGQGQLRLVMKPILFYHILGLRPFWSSYLKQLMNTPPNSSMISEQKMFRSKWVALDKRSQVSLTFGKLTLH